MRKRQKTEHELHKARKTQSAEAGKAAATVLQMGLPRIENHQRPNESTPPAWQGKVHESHDTAHVGGFVFCNRCGALAAVPASRSGLFKQCPAKADVSWKLPPGSASRLASIQAGKHPECAADSAKQKAWPDGRAGCVALGVHKCVSKAANLESGNSNEDDAKSVASDQSAELWPEWEPPRSVIRAAQSLVTKMVTDAVEQDVAFDFQSLHLMLPSLCAGRFGRVLAIVGAHAETDALYSAIASWRIGELRDELAQAVRSAPEFLAAPGERVTIAPDVELARAALDSWQGLAAKLDEITALVAKLVDTITVSDGATSAQEATTLAVRQLSTSLEGDAVDGQQALVIYLEGPWEQASNLLDSSAANKVEWHLWDLVENLGSWAVQEREQNHVLPVQTDSFNTDSSGIACALGIQQQPAGNKEHGASTGQSLEPEPKRPRTGASGSAS